MFINISMLYSLFKIYKCYFWLRFKKIGSKSLRFDVEIEEVNKGKEEVLYV